MATILQFRRTRPVRSDNIARVFPVGEYGPSYRIVDCRPDVYELRCEAERLQAIEADTRRDLKAARRHYRWQAFKATLSRFIGSDAFFLACGALVATDLCLVIYLAGGGR